MFSVRSLVCRQSVALLPEAQQAEMSGNMENKQLRPPYDQVCQMSPPSYDQVIQSSHPQYNQISQPSPPQYDQITQPLPRQNNETTRPLSQEYEPPPDDLSSISNSSTTISIPSNTSTRESCENLDEHSGHYTSTTWIANEAARMQAPYWVIIGSSRYLEYPNFRDNLISRNETEESCAKKCLINCLSFGCSLSVIIFGPIVARYIFQIIKERYFA